MAMKKTTNTRAAGEPDESKTFRIETVDGKSRERLPADISTEGLFTNASLVMTFGKNLTGDTAITETVQSLRATVAEINRGELSAAESLLMSQAVALNAMFGELARRSGLNMGEHLDATDRYMRLALKAQGQCRATLETLAAIKNPPVVFARQANINNGGQQQINNGPEMAPASCALRAVEIQQTGSSGAPVANRSTPKLRA